MIACPKDGRPCIDDLCRSGGCMQMDGYPMIEICTVCKGTVDRYMIDAGTCICADEYPDNED